MKPFIFYFYFIYFLTPRSFALPSQLTAAQPSYLTATTRAASALTRCPPSKAGGELGRRSAPKPSSSILLDARPSRKRRQARADGSRVDRKTRPRGRSTTGEHIAREKPRAFSPLPLHFPLQHRWWSIDHARAYTALPSTSVGMPADGALHERTPRSSSNNLFDARPSR